MTGDCIFCRIIKGEAPATFVYKDDDMVAFHNIKPSAPVHVLIVPVEHIESVNALEERHSAIIAKMILKAKEIAKSLGIHESGYRLGNKCRQRRGTDYIPPAHTSHWRVGRQSLT